MHGPVSLGIAAIETLVSNQDNAYIDDPCTVRRTIFVPADDVSPIDFDITAEQRDALYQRGLQAGQDVLEDVELRRLSVGLRRPARVVLAIRARSRSLRGDVRMRPTSSGEAGRP